jgi:hypothetical protein
LKNVDKDITMTEKCRFGLVAKPRDSRNNYLLFLGEINEKDEKLLYNLHKELRFLCKFKAAIVGNDILPDNAEEILAFQKKYNIEPKFSVSGVIKEKTLRLLAPELYDITCMVPLFSDTVMRNIKPICNLQSKVFFIFPRCNDPFMRGKIIDTCFEAAAEREMFFYLIGCIYGINRIKTSILTRRYLRSCGVEDKNIVCDGEDQGHDWLFEAINMIKFITPDENPEILIAVDRELMNVLMNYIRSEKASGRIDKKVRIICA